MKLTLTRRLVSFFLLLIVSSIASSIALAPLAQARPGGGRSMGFRGTRGFGTRQAPTTPNRYQGQQPTQQPQTFGNSAPMSGGLMSGGFMRGMMGGLAGGMIGSMLFGSMGRSDGLGGMGGGGIGLLEIIALLGLGFMVFRFIQGRKLSTPQANQEMTGRYTAVEPMQGPALEQACAETLSRYNAGFDLTNLKEDRMDDFMKLQAAWNHRDISSLSGGIAPELKSQLEADLADLKANGRINKIDNIAVRSTELIEAWQERGYEYATLRFRANLIDYTVDETSGQVVAGDQLQPVKFEEDWTFTRDLDQPVSPSSWKLTSIEA